MLGTFLDKMGGFFDRRFLVAYVIPTLVTLGLIIGLIQVQVGPKTTIDWWSKLEFQEQILVAISVLLIVIVSSYIFEMLTAPLVRLYEGYWNEGILIRHIAPVAIYLQRVIMNRYARTAHRRVLSAKRNELMAIDPITLDEQQVNSLKENIASIDEQIALEKKRAYDACYYKFPRDTELLKPTMMGNVLAAAEEYSYQVYRLDAVIWWPRLTTLLPESFRIQVDMALTPMLTVLNLSVIFSLLAMTSVGFLLVKHQWYVYGTIIILGLLLARVFYSAAINQAAIYGKLIRVAFDLYRQEILKKMHIPVPDNLVAERALWDILTNWHYFYIVPWDVKDEIPELENPFYYDTHQTSLNPVEHQEVILSFKVFPNLAIKEKMMKWMKFKFPLQLGRNRT
jgi:hypothetical protein